MYYHATCFIHTLLSELHSFVFVFLHHRLFYIFGNMLGWTVPDTLLQLECEDL
ncbi:hypothetical protein BDW69DRAFT_170124 [Aspergillus filifer]